MTKQGFDVIVVGARAAGAAMAMLLARAGMRVLAVDRARFPSDTLSTHQVQVPGVDGRKLAQLIPDATLTVVPDSYAHVPLDAPQPVADAINSLLA